MSKFEEKVIDQIRSRAEHGLNKYGVSVERTDLTPIEWIQHAKEEAMDLTVYLERLQAEGQLMPERLWRPLLDLASCVSNGIPLKTGGMDFSDVLAAAEKEGFQPSLHS